VSPPAFAREAGEGCRAEARRAKAGECIRELRLGMPRELPMTYVYILNSLGHPERHYVGITADLRARLKRHNAGEVSHTSKFTPWGLKTYVAFSDEKQAVAFEKYLKSPSGRAFSKKRL
jgi:putative endonuclease